MIGIAPGPANGFTLDLIDCFERFGSIIDWAMIILNPLEPWPGELCLKAAAAADIKVITRVVDYGGLFYGDLKPGQEMVAKDHRGFRPSGWIEDGVGRIDSMRPIADRAGLSMIQLACQWNLAHEPVQCVVPTLIQEIGPDARLVEDKRDDLAAHPGDDPPHPLRGRADPKDRRQHRQHGAQGRQPRALRRRAPRPLGHRRAPRGRRAPVGDRTGARPRVLGGGRRHRQVPLSSP